MADFEFRQVANIKVFGVGGAGCNAVNRMVSEGARGVTFYVCNTDKQVLETSPVENKILLGRDLTGGLGAGGNPEIGKKAAQENEAEIREAIKGSDMVFITAGLGGGTGTGAAPYVARIAKEEGVLTVGVVTKPFTMEGRRRMTLAMEGLNELKQYTDSLIIVSNNSLIEVIGRRPMKEAFKAADNVLRQGVQTITDLIAIPALINLDFADVRSVMENQGAALIGVGIASGENKAREAAEKAVQSPLLETQIYGARNAIINITGGENVTLFDAEDAVNCICEAAGNQIDAYFGVAINESLDDEIIVTVIATGFADVEEEPQQYTAPVRGGNDNTRRAPVQEADEDDIIPNFFRR